eukprot:TRINITY_DN635_c0_g2_i3.p1 TRINITY_DN635_c0_g2~~TRINITY_DN635_c0_g2_i3.p1  ORF type:complete len:409 (-),score=56.65 TRINITY_DN635_c0_g2_i3:57-1283(-)
MKPSEVKRPPLHLPKHQNARPNSALSKPASSIPKSQPTKSPVPPKKPNPTVSTVKKTSLPTKTIPRVPPPRPIQEKRRFLEAKPRPNSYELEVTPRKDESLGKIEIETSNVKSTIASWNSKRPLSTQQRTNSLPKVKKENVETKRTVKIRPPWVDIIPQSETAPEVEQIVEDNNATKTETVLDSNQSNIVPSIEESNPKKEEEESFKNIEPNQPSVEAKDQVTSLEIEKTVAETKEEHQNETPLKTLEEKSLPSVEGIPIQSMLTKRKTEREEAPPLDQFLGTCKKKVSKLMQEKLEFTAKLKHEKEEALKELHRKEIVIKYSSISHGLTPKLSEPPKDNHKLLCLACNQSLISKGPKPALTKMLRCGHKYHKDCLPKINNICVKCPAPKQSSASKSEKSQIEFEKTV